MVGVELVWKASAAPPPRAPSHSPAAMAARFPLDRWRTTGVRPGGAQVRRVTTSSQT